MLYEIIPVYGNGSGMCGSARKDTEGAVEHAAWGIDISGYVYGGEMGKVSRADLTVLGMLSLIPAVGIVSAPSILR